MTLTDRDGNGVASAGDRISVMARDCSVPVLTDIATGTIEIELRDTTGLQGTALRGHVDFGAGLSFAGAFATAQSETVKLAGSMLFETSSSDITSTLRALSSAADDLQVQAPRFGGVSAESIRDFTMSKALNYADARSVLSFDFRYESEAFGGSFHVSTPEPLLAYLNTYPEQGRMLVSGAAGSLITLRPNFTLGSSSYQIELDLTGDGFIDARGQVEWSQVIPGFAWWDGVKPLQWAFPVFMTRTYLSTGLSVDLRFAWTSATDTVFLVQFSRPLAETTTDLQFRFADRGSDAANADWTLTNIAASATRQGAVFVVKPLAGLRHGRRYDLQFSQNGSDWLSTIVVQDTLANSVSLSPMSLSTPDTLRAVASASAGVLLSSADRAQLSAAGSIGTIRPIVSYRWTQTAGTPLRIASPDAASTEVSWGDTLPTGADTATLRLTVTDTAGDTDWTSVVVRSASLAGTTRLLYMRGTAGDYIVGDNVVVHADNTGTFHTDSLNSGYANTLFYGANPGTFWNLSFATIDGAPMVAGAYENAIRAPFREHQNGIDVGGDGRGCNQITGRFDVLEIQVDANGNLLRFAIDFEQHCEGPASPPLFGSYRLNSTIPLRR
ncbi:MAG: hypothetical protein Q8R33_20775 [Burkholderiales bacterium]|nr:hypothetical protein [Burkholderiales bacterium]